MPGACWGCTCSACTALTTRDPFLDPRLIASRKFFLSLVLISCYGLLTVPPMVLMPAFLEHLRGYAIDAVGLLQSPRGLGLLMALFVSGRITGKVDPRILIAVGLLCLAVSSGEMSTLDGGGRGVADRLDRLPAGGRRRDHAGARSR